MDKVQNIGLSHILRRTMWIPLIFLLILSGAAYADEQAQVLDCTKLLIKNYLTTPPKNASTIRSIQNCLDNNNIKLKYHDGRFGPETRAGLEAYLNSSKIKLNASAKVKPVVNKKPAEMGNGDKANVTNLDQLISLNGISNRNFDETKQINWTGNNCGCVRAGLSGITYAFYPYWLAGKPQQIDFSYFSRIAYFGLTFNQNGEFTNRLDWTPDWQPKNTLFVNEARKYGTKIDLVIYQANWQCWKYNNKNCEKKDGKYIIPNKNGGKNGGLNYPNADVLSNNIIRLVEAKLDNTVFNRHRRLFTFGASSTPSIANGVTLDFANYPSDQESTRYLLDFIHALRNKLNKAGKNYYLNLVVSSSMFGNGFLNIKNLSELIPVSAKGTTSYGDEDYINLFLVPFSKDSSREKKDLRKKIEKMTPGMGILRRNLLRKIVPVIMPVGLNNSEVARSQLKDDLIYFEDNFAGVGFWPIPMSVVKNPSKNDKINNVASDQIRASLAQYYQKRDAASPSALGDFICVHKWYFRISFDIVTLLLLLFGVTAIFSCKVREFWKRYSWFGLIAIILWVVLGLFYLVYDRFNEIIAKGNWPLILLLALNIIYIGWRIYKRYYLARRA